MKTHGTLLWWLCLTVVYLISICTIPICVAFLAILILFLLHRFAGVPSYDNIPLFTVLSFLASIFLLAFYERRHKTVDKAAVKITRFFIGERRPE
jgi:hypothetical protein